MGRSYRQLTLEERCTIARLHEDGQSLQKIAAALDRSASTISRELNRNKGSKVGYRPAYAHEQAWARRWTGARLERDEPLRGTVLDRLAHGWSPQQVAGRLALDAGHDVISHESIYRFIHAQIRRTNDSTWSRYLPRGKARRGWHRKSKGPASFIQQRVPISEPPLSANNRKIAGHWEADFMLFATYGQAILVAHERRSRITLIKRLPNRKADLTAKAIADLLAPLPPSLRRSITFDNGTEFARHFLLHDQIDVDTFFCDPHSPWQKGGVENAIGRIRRYLPRKTDLDRLSPQQICASAFRYNNIPRKCLDFKTPAEAFSLNLLHFECESTSRLSSG